MQVYVKLQRAEDRIDVCLNKVFIAILLDVIDEDLYRTPDYVIYGKKKASVRFFGLSKKEADMILKVVTPEIGGIVSAAKKYESKNEEDTGVFYSAVPEYNEGVEERIKNKHGYGMSIEKVVKAIYNITARSMVQDGAQYPLSTMALAKLMLSG